MKTRHHFCQSLEGALRNWTKKEWLNMAVNNNMTVEDVKNEFHILMAQGKRVIPIGECDNFSFEDGCRGHKMEETQVGIKDQTHDDHINND